MPDSEGTDGRLRQARQQFAKDRFVVLKAPFPDATDELCRTISALDLRAAEILEQCGHSAQIVREFVKTSPLELIVVPEQSAPHLICRYEYILGASDQLREIERQYIRPAVETVVGMPLSIFKDKMNRKPAGGGACGPHQDHEAYGQFPPRWYVTIMIAIDAATEANGCLQFAPNLDQVVRDRPDCVASWIGKQPLLRVHDGGRRNGEILDDIGALLDWRPIPTGSGDVVIFDSFIPHRSEPNTSQRPRRALFLTYSLAEGGDWYDCYYQTKRARYDDPMFHVGTPTAHARE